MKEGSLKLRDYTLNEVTERTCPKWNRHCRLTLDENYRPTHFVESDDEVDSTGWQRGPVQVMFHTREASGRWVY